MQDIIKKLLKKHVKGDIELEIPPDPKLGDYAFPCFGLAKELKKKPNTIAFEIAEKLLKQLPDEIKDIQVHGPYINFFINPEFLVKQTLAKIYKEKD